MNKHYISPAQLLTDAYQLAWQVFASGYRPDFLLAVWRGGAPVGAAVHELLTILGVQPDHTAIRAASYTGIGQRREQVRIDGLEYVTGRIAAGDRLLLVDDVHDTGLTLQQVILELEEHCGPQMPEVRIATPWFKPGSNRSGRVPDYFIHETDDWLVFPHELDGLTVAEMRANKPELGAVMECVASHLQGR